MAIEKEGGGEEEGKSYDFAAAINMAVKVFFSLGRSSLLVWDCDSLIRERAREMGEMEKKAPCDYNH